MGLDLILGALILISALRGWFRGFFSQAIRLGGLASCVYLAGPVRDLVRPAVAEHVGGMSPELLSKLLWWTSAVVSYVVVTGLATWVLRAVQRRQDREHPAPNYRGDQSAGALLGAAKGLVVVAFLLAGIDRYAPKYVEAGGWIGEQVGESRALGLSRQFEPAERIWESEPVRAYVEHVRRMGIEGAPAVEPASPGTGEAEAPIRTARRPRPMAVSPPRPAPRPQPEPDPLDPSAPDFDLERALKTLREELEHLDPGGVDSR